MRMREATRQSLVYRGYLISGMMALLIRHLKWVANNKMMFGKRGVWLVWAALEVPFHGVGGGGACAHRALFCLLGY